jgi:hypothetical protein
VLAGGGCESRGTMSAATDSKADSVQREMRNRTQHLQDTAPWHGTMDEYENLDTIIDDKLYAIYEDEE